MFTTLDLNIGEKISGAMTIRWYKKADKFWLPKFYGQYNALASGRPLTHSTIIRLHRAQLRLAGYPVDGWPFIEPDKLAMSEYCDCDKCGGQMDLWYSNRQDYLLCQKCKNKVMQ